MSAEQSNFMQVLQPIACYVVDRGDGANFALAERSLPDVLRKLADIETQMLRPLNQTELAKDDDTPIVYKITRSEYRWSSS